MSDEKFIGGIMRREVNDAASSVHAVHLIREWCDNTETAMEKSIKTAPPSAANYLFAYNAGLMAAVHQVRALLPEVPPAVEEAACPTATSDP